MTDLLNSSVVLPLKTARDELTPLNRTVKHTLSLASERGLLTVPPDSQHQRRAPSTWGCRCDAFFWDAWDRSIRGEDDMHRFFQIAQRIGGSLAALEETDAANLLPGGVMDTIGSCSDLFLPDYWLFVVHHLGSTWQLPYECHLKWSHGTTYTDEPYAVVSRLPVNIVQASIDALTVLIEAAVPFEWSPVDCQPASLAGANDDSKPIALLPLETSAQQQAGVNGRRLRKRAERAANIEALTHEMRRHNRDARDHAQAMIDHGREPKLLPRPSQKELAERVGITVSAASRCFNDPSATELRVLWETADDLEALLKYIRSPAS